MTEVLVLVLVLVLVVVAGLIARRARTFGGLAAAFSRGNKAERDELVAARKTLQAALKERDAHLTATRRAADTAVAAYENRVQRSQAVVSHLSDPGQGGLLLNVGAIALHEHMLFVSGQALPLLGLQVAVQPTYNMIALVLQLPGGRRLSQPFSTEWRTGDQGRSIRDHDDAEIQRLADSVHNAVLAETEFRAALPRLMTEAQSALAIAEGDTGAMAETLARLDTAQNEGLGTDAALAAHERLVIVEDRWTARLSAGVRQGDRAKSRGVAVEL